MLFIPVSESDFILAFVDMGKKDQFSIEALKAIYKHLDERSKDLEKHIELDVIAICYEFSETTFDEILERRGDIDRDNALDEFKRQLEKNHNWVVRLSKSFVYVD